MLFSYNKLKQLANLPTSVSIEQVNNAINSIGFEVESCEPFTNVKGIKFAKVLSIKKNPNSDKLTMCQLKFSDKERLIQTTATNVEVGATVIAFIPGSSLNGIVFEAKELKGVLSEGMLSAPSEFGIDKDLIRKELNEGITKYDVEDISLDPIEYLGLNDYIIDIKILSNRADANSYFSMALELAAYFETKVVFPKRALSTFKAEIKAEVGVAKSLVFVEGKKDFTISIQDQIFLAKSNVKSINDIADLTNLTLLMTGQPTHAYDKKAVGNNFKAEHKSGMVKAFGDKEVTLEKDLVITSDNEIVSIAGVIGIEGRGVNHSTIDFILEMGRFNIKDVRKAAKAVKLNTMASNQSSKEFNRTLTKWAIDYISTIAKNLSNTINEQEVENKTIPYSSKTIDFLAGKPLANDAKYSKAIKSLETLGYEFNGDKVKVASHIGNIELQQDMNEEVFRFYGYDNFLPQKPTLVASAVQLVKPLHEKIAAQGYKEVVTYSLVSKIRNNFNPFKFSETIKLETFVSKEREEIRNSIIPSLLEVVLYNTKRKITDVSIFDIGMINNGIKTLGIVSTTKTYLELANDLKNIFGEELVFERFTNEHVHSGVSGLIKLENKIIGWIGKLHPSQDETNSFVAEVMIPSQTKEVAFKDYSSNPLKQRDFTIALEIKEDTNATIEKFRKYDIYNVNVIDQFLKDNKNHVTFKVTASEEACLEIEKDFKK